MRFRLDPEPPQSDGEPTRFWERVTSRDTRWAGQVAVEIDEDCPRDVALLVAVAPAGRVDEVPADVEDMHPIEGCGEAVGRYEWRHLVVFSRRGLSADCYRTIR